MPKTHALIARPVETRILFIRGHRVLLDTDLAELYGVSVKRLNQQVKRNQERFPADFMFHLTAREGKILRLQNATSSSAHGGRRYLPYAFTEHGAIMAASILNSPRAVEMSVLVVRAFVRLRELLGRHKQLAARLSELERRLGTHDAHIRELFDAIRELMEAPTKPRKPIGFRADAAKGTKALKAGGGG